MPRWRVRFICGKPQRRRGQREIEGDFTFRLRARNPTEGQLRARLAQYLQHEAKFVPSGSSAEDFFAQQDVSLVVWLEQRVVLVHMAQCDENQFRGRRLVPYVGAAVAPSLSTGLGFWIAFALDTTVRVCEGRVLVQAKLGSGASEAPLFLASWTEEDKRQPKPRDAVLKLVDPNLPSLMSEWLYYHDVVPRLREHTPHLVTMLDSCELEPLQVRRLAPGLDPRAVVLALVLERAPGSSLFSTLIRYRPRWNAQQSRKFDVAVLLQVAQALCVFEQFKFMHNDLHLGNIFCELLDKPRRVGSYLVQGMPLHSRVFVRIFDFDRSSAAGAPNPGVAPDTDNCRLRHQCQGFTAKWDFYFVLAGFDIFLQCFEQHDPRLCTTYGKMDADNNFVEDYSSALPDVVRAATNGGPKINAQPNLALNARLYPCSVWKGQRCVFAPAFLDRLPSPKDFLARIELDEFVQKTPDGPILSL